MCSEDGVVGAFKSCKEKFGKVNGLVNCAAIAYGEKTFDIATQRPHLLEHFRETLEVS